MSDVVQKLWGFCHTLRHEGIDYGDYIEQITYLLFLKMADERGIDLSALPYEEEGEDGRRKTRKKNCSWPALRERSGVPLTDHYAETLRILGKQPGILGDIYAGAQSRFHNPVNLKKLVSLIDETEWTSLGVDVKAEAYEGLLEKAASEGKKGAGQYFTPRVLIQSIVRCMRPDPRVRKDFTISDPACGTGGFLVAAYEWLMGETRGGALDRNVTKRIRTKTYRGQELVARPRRMALMNLYLHQLEPDIRLGDTIYETASDEKFDVILTNPPFGTKGANQAPDRDDFTIETSNKQLNFLQHILTVLKPGGRAAVVIPDNCLFADQAGEVFEIITHDCDVHTILRLPRGTFTPYSQGVKANVVFFTKGYPTERVWIYDERTNVPGITKKDRPLTAAHFAEFEHCYGKDPNGRSPRDAHDSKEDRWRSFTLAEIKERGYKFDGFKWLREESLDDSADLPEPAELVTDAIAELEEAVAELNDGDAVAGERGCRERGGSRLVTTRSAGRREPTEDEETATLPEGWASGLIGDLFDHWGGMTPSTAVPGYWGSGLAWISSKDIKKGQIAENADSITKRALAETRLRVCRPGVVLIVVRSGVLAHSLPVAITTRPVVINQDLKAFDSGNDALNEWFALYLQHKAQAILRSSRREGTTVQSVKVPELLKLAVPIPPVDEQRRIVEKVEALLARVQAARERLGTAQGKLSHFQDILAAAASSGGLFGVNEEKRTVRLFDLLSEPLANGRSVVDDPCGFPVLRLNAITSLWNRSASAQAGCLDRAAGRAISYPEWRFSRRPR